MRFDKSLELLLAHCQGELGHVLVHGAPEILGATMLDKTKHINRVDDSLRRFVTFAERLPQSMDRGRSIALSSAGLRIPN